jgi:hypothetical protein
MRYFILPLLGGCLWLAHLGQVIRNATRLRWRRAILIVFPIICFAVFLFAVFQPTDLKRGSYDSYPHCSLCATETFQIPLYNSITGLALWVALLLVEIPLQLIARRFRRDGRSAGE